MNTSYEYFRCRTHDMINSFLEAHPEAWRKNIGVIEEPKEKTIWVGEWHQKPKCSYCGGEMAEGTVIKKGERLGFPYWFCDNRYCEARKLTNIRLLTEKEKYDTEHTGDEYLDGICEKMNIPVSYRDKSLNNFKSSKKNEFRRYIKSGENLFIFGTNRAGKTHLAIGLLIEFGRKEPQICRFESVGFFLNKIYSDIKNDIDYTKQIDDICRYKLLVLDDFGSVKNSEHREEVLAMIIEGRLMGNKQTIVTSNLTIDEINTQYNERIASRLNEYRKVNIKPKQHLYGDKE